MKIYIAGFDVFRPDAIDIGKRYKEICNKYNMTGLYPLDNVVDTAGEIFLGNVSLIDECDIIVANLNSFRGMCMDDGTAWELGYGYAKGKKLYGYMNDIRPLTERFGNFDNDGNSIENFNMPINLMIGCSVTVVEGDFEDCIRSIESSL